MIDGARIQIRPATAADLPAVRTCAEDAYHPYTARIGRKPAPMVAPFKALIASGHLHVATDEHGLLGYVVFYARPDAVHLESVAVAPHAHGRGIGKSLIAFCEDAARAQGAEKIALYTNAKMVENLAIYPHLGYREVARRREDGFDRVFFEKQL